MKLAILSIVYLVWASASADVGGANVPTITMHTPGVIRVMVVDTGIAIHDDLRGYVQYDRSSNYIDNNDHGTHVAGVILYGNQNPIHFDTSDAVCDQVQLYSCRYYDFSIKAEHAFEEYIKCLNQATIRHMDAINLSLGGPDFSMSEYQALSKFVQSGGLITTAAGNYGKSLDYTPYYPATFAFDHYMSSKHEFLGTTDVVHSGYRLIHHLNNIFPVENITSQGVLDLTSNYHTGLNRALGHNVLSTKPYVGYHAMTGTSFSAPMFLHSLLKKKCTELK